MGKHRHSKDKIYIVQTEYQQDWGGYKAKSKDVPLRVLPFDCCALSLRPFTDPVCTKSGLIFDLKHIIPYLKKYSRNPVDGTKLTAKDLYPIKFHKNSDGEFHCPVTFKVFNNHTHIVANLVSGHVYAIDAITNLCQKPKHWFDPIENTPFTMADIVDLQNPYDVARRRIEEFDYVVKKRTTPTNATGLKATDATEKVRATPLMEKVLEQASKANEARREEFEKKRKVELEADSNKISRKKHKVFTSGRDTQSLTSTVINPNRDGLVDYREMTEEEERLLIYDRVRKLKAKGYVSIVTNYGPLNIELHCERAPWTCDNFLRHCESNYYVNTNFHRVIRGFMMQGGDPEGTGYGGQSAFGKPFRDEIDPILKHDSRGILSMANSGMKNDNKSQFFVTLAAAEHLDGKHTVFGVVVGGKDSLRKIELGCEMDKNDKPIKGKEVIIKETSVFVNPFKDAANELKAEDVI